MFLLFSNLYSDVSQLKMWVSEGAHAGWAAQGIGRMQPHATLSEYYSRHPNPVNVRDLVLPHPFSRRQAKASGYPIFFSGRVILKFG